MAVVFKGGLYHYRSDGTSNDETVTIDLSTGTLGDSLTTGFNNATGESIAAGDLIVTILVNQYTGGNAGTFGDLLSYDSALTLHDQFRLTAPSPVESNENCHLFYRWATGSEADVDVHVDGAPSEGVLAISVVFSGLKGSGNPFADQNTQTFNSYPINSSGIGNTSTWDPGTEQGASATVVPNNGGVLIAIYMTGDDDGSLTLNSANGFTSVGSGRMQDTVNRGEMLVAYRELDNGDAGSSITPPTCTNNTGTSETMLLVYMAAFDAGVVRTEGYRYDLMTLSSAAKAESFGVGQLQAASGGTSSGGVPQTQGAPPPPINYTQSTGGVLFAATADATIANTTTETSLFGTGEGSLTLPAGFLAAGRTLDLRLRGQLSDTGTPNLTIKLKLGSTVVCSVGPTALTGVSSVEWMLDLMLTCRTAGASGVVVAGGLFDYDDGTELSLSSGSNINVDTTGTLALDVTWQWGTADASNTITTRGAVVT